MKRIIFLFSILIIASSINATNDTIETTQVMTFSPDDLTIYVGDTVTFINTGGSHNVNGTTATFPSNPTSFSNPTGVSSGWTYTHIFTLAGTYNYQCDPHIPSMTGVIIVNNITDCNGVVGGTSITDSCGDCQQAYIYDFVTHAVTLLDDTTAVVLTGTEMLVMPNNPANPYWNANCTDCNGIIDGTAMEDTCGICHQAYIYNFITHNVTFIDDTIGVVVGNDEILVMPDNPDNPYWNDCDSTTNIITIQPNSTRKIIKVVNILGKEIKHKIYNQPLIYIYSDGTIEKRILIK